MIEKRGLIFALSRLRVIILQQTDRHAFKTSLPFPPVTITIICILQTNYFTYDMIKSRKLMNKLTKSEVNKIYFLIRIAEI